MAASHSMAASGTNAPADHRVPLNPVAVRFGENLVQRRERTDLSQEELSCRATLHRTEISLLERGARVPRIDTLVKLAGGLGCAPEALLAGIVWNPGQVTIGRFRLGEEASDGRR